MRVLIGWFARQGRRLSFPTSPPDMRSTGSRDGTENGPMACCDIRHARPSHPMVITYKLRRAIQVSPFFACPLWDMTGCNWSYSTCCTSFLAGRILLPSTAYGIRNLSALTCLSTLLSLSVRFPLFISLPVALQVGVGRRVSNPVSLFFLLFFPTYLGTTTLRHACFRPFQGRIVP